MTSYSEETKRKAVNLLLTGTKTQREVALELGIPRGTLVGWLHAFQEGSLAFPVDADNEEDPANQALLKLKDELRATKSELAAVQRDNITAKKVREEIIGLTEMAPSPPQWTIDPSRHESPLVPMVMWSDWHWGEVVDLDQMGGINSFNMIIAQERVKTLVEKTIMLIKRQNSEIPGVVINLGGDMISGDIHEELTETNDAPVMPAFLDLFGVLVWAIEEMLLEFGKVFVPGVAGNHGRTTHKPRMKNRAYSNFDWLLYSLLEKHFEANENVIFQIPTGPDAHYQVYGHSFFLTHGDNLGTAGGDGMIGALGPILRGDFKVRRASAAEGINYDTLVIGHWHQYLPLTKVIVNGSLKGYDEYAKMKLRAHPELPIQALWFVSPKHGIVSQHPVLCEEADEDELKKEWVSWPK